ncbi:enoyl-[acyl-carrier protein] reductase II [Serratia fonticola]|jgi:enoyl-[acyl-carrier protein] reductase II|uniref:Enoyl-[acyl-carrier protein] reductase II n=1 Tax=Serratia fonticola TaxID=47917 RepID=A0A542BR94_SERFO|nr:nitronate monooxygenase [Serratia fonticola]TQI81056.1 enoyl-[acyl-carrier protein] reductase II [Serratia fonticola]TQI96920.1 enoyl-[acyl-carrier protein] reductase II [Serratia fonticola]TVZ71415.1 enoyl-[acyl-carrier protein] reductase II [Serratia fonticola]
MKLQALLGIETPVIQASMVWLNSAELAAAVSNAGGLGVLGPNAGRQVVSGKITDTVQAFRQEIRKTRRLTDNPFAVNYLLPIEGVDISFRYAEPLLEVILQEKVSIVITSGKGLTQAEQYIRRLKDAGIIVIHREISPTVENAMQAEALGVDAIIITGHEAGGHLSEHRISTLVLLPQVTDVVKIPVIAAGGIYNQKTAKAAMAMGAAGVYVGTRFITTFESPASLNTKQAIIDVQSEELVEINTPAGDIRVIATESILSGQGESDVGVIKKGMLDGDHQHGVITVSEAAGGISQLSSVKEVVCELSQAFG